MALIPHFMRETAPTFVTKVVTLYNFLSVPFTFYWAKTPYTLQAGEKMRMEDWKARHAAKHMTDQWYNENASGKNRHVEDAFINKMKEAVLDDGIAPAPATPGEISRQQTEMLNEKPLEQNIQVATIKPILCGECGTTGFRHKRGCSKAKPKVA